MCRFLAPRGLRVRILPLVALVATGFLLNGCKSRSSASPPLESPQQLSVQPDALPIHANAPRLVCPPIDSSIAATASSTKGGHRVVLSWNASARDSKHGTAVGYCLYRATGPNTRATERINILPFAGTKCVDDLVENGKKYYYVVRAISAQGITSLVSKPAPALIPSSPPSASNTPANAPLCREPQPAQ